MLSNWGYLYFHIGQGLAYAELDLLNDQRNGTRDVIEANNPAIAALHGHLSTIVAMVDFQEMGTIPRDAEILKATIDAARNHRSQLGRFVQTSDILKDVRRLKNDFRYLLEKRKFYSISPELMKYYGKPRLFGERVAKKFKAAVGDIERAGNCLALGEPTACVLHLNRAMEIATRRLAAKLPGMPRINAKDSWGMVLGKMTDPIKNLPDKTERQKRKKEMWAECRTESVSRKNGMARSWRAWEAKL